MVETRNMTKKTWLYADHPRIFLKIYHQKNNKAVRCYIQNTERPKDWDFPPSSAMGPMFWDVKASR